MHPTAHEMLWRFDQERLEKRLRFSRRLKAGEPVETESAAPIVAEVIELDLAACCEVDGPIGA